MIAMALVAETFFPPFSPPYSPPRLQLLVPKICRSQHDRRHYFVHIFGNHCHQRRQLMMRPRVHIYLLSPFLPSQLFLPL